MRVHSLFGRKSRVLGVAGVAVLRRRVPEHLVQRVRGAAGTATPTTSQVITSTGLRPGQIKHVFLIILENKSYDATFTGLNQNSYLWKTLPSQGCCSRTTTAPAISAGQLPEPGLRPGARAGHPVRLRESNFDFGSNATSSRPGRNHGQVASLANAASPSRPTPRTANGCTYPTAAPTLFNQLDAVGKTWKGYAQDLHNQPGREDSICGGPVPPRTTRPRTRPNMSPTRPFPTGVVSFTGAQANDQYVAKHFPFPWFHSLDRHGDPDARPHRGHHARGGIRLRRAAHRESRRPDARPFQGPAARIDDPGSNTQLKPV